MQYERNCKQCGAAFSTDDLRKIFCSKKCAFANHNAKRKTTKEDDRECTVCGERFKPHQIRGVGRTTCSADCWKKHRAAWAKEKRATTPSWRDREIRSAFKRKYGITREQFDEMFKRQNGLCVICGRPPVRGSLQVDHHHGNGRVRGLLCQSCNGGLGLFGDSVVILQKAIEYLKD